MYRFLPSKPNVHRLSSHSEHSTRRTHYRHSFNIQHSAFQFSKFQQSEYTANLDLQPTHHTLKPTAAVASLIDANKPDGRSEPGWWHHYHALSNETLWPRTRPTRKINLAATRWPPCMEFTSGAHGLDRPPHPANERFDLMDGGVGGSRRKMLRVHVVHTCYIIYRKNMSRIWAIYSRKFRLRIGKESTKADTEDVEGQRGRGFV